MMHEEPLSPAEIQSLLGNLAPPESEQAGLAAHPAGKLPDSPHSFDPQTLDGLRRIHEEFCRGASRELAALLNVDVAMALVNVQQAPWRELTARVAVPTCLGIWEADPWACRVAIMISPAILYPLLDRLLGGRGKLVSPLPQRPLTDIETTLVDRLMQPLALELQLAWQEVLLLALRGQRIECDCQTASLAVPDEAVVAIACDVAMEDSRGPLQVWIPRAALESHTHRLTAAGLCGSTTAAKESGRGALVELAANLAETTMTVEQLLNLKPGDIIPTSQPITGPVVVTVEGLPKFHGRVGQHQGRLAVRIEERVAPGRADGDGQRPDGS